MNKEEYIKSEEKEVERGIIMSVLAKPMDVAFVVKENKVNAFMKSQSRSRSRMNKILERAKRIEGNIGHKE